MAKPNKAKKPFNKRKLIIAGVVAAMIGIPLSIGYQYVEPLIFQPAKKLIARIPVTYRDLTPIPVRYRAIRQIPVRVIPKGASGIRVKYKDLSRIKIIHKNSAAEQLPDVEGLTRMQVRHRFSNGVRPPSPDE